MFIKKNNLQLIVLCLIILFSPFFRVQYHPNVVQAAQEEQQLIPRTVRIDLIADSWVQVIVDGQVLFEGLLRAGESREWSGQDIFLKVGNAGGVEVTLDGESLGLLGAVGQVVSQRWQAQVANPTPTGIASPPPTMTLTVLASATATALPAASPTALASATPEPVASATAAPVASPTAAPVASPTAAPVASPTAAPVASPTAAPVASPEASESGFEEQSLWSEPLNISNSGAASEPLLLASQSGGWQVFWMDQFDGLMMTRRSAGEWQKPQAIPLFIDRTMPSGEITRIPVSVRPDLFVDQKGTIHALWLSASSEEENSTDSLDVSFTIQAANRPPTLYYSQLTPGSTTWSPPIAVDDSGLAWDLVEDAAGRLQLLSLHPSQNESQPAGIYSYWRNPSDSSWGGERLLYQNLYFRLLSTSEAHIQAVANQDALYIHAVWDNPRFNESYYVRSTDGGESWSPPEKINDKLQQGTQKIQVGVTASGEVLRLWQSKEEGVSCTFYQQRSTDRGSTWDEPKEVLTDLTRCPANWRFLNPEDGRLLWIADEGSATLQLAAWDGSAYSATKRLEFRFDGLENGESLSLISLQVSLLGELLAVVGQGQNNEIWYLESKLSAFDFVKLPPSPWAEATNLSQNMNSPRLPAITSDNQGQVHMLWSEAPTADEPATALIYARWNKEQWIRQGEVLLSGDAISLYGADEPDLVAVGERLHAVWSGGRAGEVLYGRVDIKETAASAWSPPKRLPAPALVGCCPVIAADGQGTLHVVYAIPLNENRGLYYTRSEDGGQSWLPQTIIFDAVSANWNRIKHPRLAVDQSGIIHVVWVKAGLPGSVTEGIYYSQSTDGGKSWLEAEALATGSYDWPELATSANGQVDIIWQSPQISEYLEWEHLYSTNQGQDWSPIERVPVLLGVNAPISLNSDGAGNLYLMGIALIYGAQGIEQYQLRSAIWNGESWTKSDSFQLDIKGTKIESGISAVLEPTKGRIHLAFRGKTEQTGVTQENLWLTNRQIEVAANTNSPSLATSVPEAANQTASSPTPEVMVTITPTPLPAISTERAPEGIDQNISLVFSGLLAFLVVGIVFAVQLFKNR